jgi:hypothetical protein
MKLLNFQMPPDGFKRLFYDIETSPNIGFFWSSSYKANIPHDNIIKERAVICICWLQIQFKSIGLLGKPILR